MRKSWGHRWFFLLNTSSRWVPLALVGFLVGACASKKPQLVSIAAVESPQVSAVEAQPDVKKLKSGSESPNVGSQVAKAQTSESEGEETAFSVGNPTAEQLVEEFQKELEDEVAQVQPKLAQAPPLMVLYRRGRKAYEKAQWAAAIKDWNRFLALMPDHVYADRARYFVIRAHFQLGEFEKALDLARTFEARYPYSFKRGELVYTRGMAFLRLGRVEPAVFQFEEVLRRFAEDPIARSASHRLAELKESIAAEKKLQNR